MRRIGYNTMTVYPRLPADLADCGMFCLLHVGDKGDHILINDKLDIIGIIDWEWSKDVVKPFAFAAPIMLLPLAFD